MRGRPGAVFPRRASTAERMALAEEIARRLTAALGSNLSAVGVYGSLARGEAGPYSDLEMYAVVRNPVEVRRYEFVYRGLKVEVDVDQEQDLLREAATVDERWPLKTGSFVDVQPLHDPGGFFDELRRAALAVPEEATRAALRQAFVDEVCETIGKLRNAQAGGNSGYLPLAAHDLVWQTATLLGLARRRPYKSRATVIPASLALTPLPRGYRELADLVTSGRLADPGAVARACDELWAGLVEWLGDLGLDFASEELPF